MNLAVVAATLQILREADPRLECFGAAAHRYQLRPCVPEAEVLAFEQKHSVRLPDEYRQFLTELGNGGAGSCYGIFPLGVYDDQNLEPHLNEGLIGDLTRPFPHADAWNASDDYWERQPDIDEDEEAYDTWLEDYTTHDLIEGSLPICHEGCGFFFLLVVTGPDRGKMWLDGRASDEGIMPVTDEGSSRVTFGEWYDSWLDRCLRERGLSSLQVAEKLASQGRRST